MRIERRWVGLLGVTTFTALWALTVACGDATTWPETVLSGNPRGSAVGGSSGSTSGVDAGEPDVGTGDDGGVAVFTCQTFGAQTGTRTVYTDVPEAAATGLQSSCTSGGGTVGTACPDTGTGGSVNGCCTTDESGYTEEQCFYGANNNPLGSQTGSCTGTFSLTPTN
jgi:hypothetical protein